MLRLILAVLALFVLWEASDIVIHGVILGKTYAALPDVFRPVEGEGKMNMPLLMLVVLAQAAVFTKIYAWLVSPKNVLTGVVFGLLWGVGHGVGMGYAMYATQPIPASMASTMCLGAIVQGILGGIVVAMIVQRRDEPALGK